MERAWTVLAALALGCAAGEARTGSAWDGPNAEEPEADGGEGDEGDDEDEDEDDGDDGPGDSGPPEPPPDSGPMPPGGDDGDAGTTTGDDPSLTGGFDETTGAPEDEFVPDADAEELVELVNAYRVSQGLPAIPQSNALMLVAYSHAEDLHINRPDGGSCNMHSWSDLGEWSGCCYTADHAEAECMWDKPRELTDYPGNGYENAAGGVGPITPAQALTAWQGSAGHNDVILNQGVWASHPWQALGAAVYGDYAVLWFGEEAG